MVVFTFCTVCSNSLKFGLDFNEFMRILVLQQYPKFSTIGVKPYE